MRTRSALAMMGPARLRSWWAARGHDLREVETFVTFVGHPRSGGTLVAALLDAHPDAVISIELHALRRLKMGYGQRALLGAVLERNQEFVASGSGWSGYDYEVPGQWQGRYRTLRVIGDKKAGGTSLHLLLRPHLLQSLAATVGVPVRVVGVTRHPLDNIARMATRSRTPLADAAERYFTMAEGMAVAAGVCDVLWLPHEGVTADPSGCLRQLLGHVGLDEPTGWIEGCAAKVSSLPRPARREVQWPAGLPDRIMERAAGFPFLAAYGSGH